MPVITVSLISGTILTAQGNARNAIKVQFVPLNTPYVVGADVVSTTNQEITTDVNGAFSLNLAYGSYRVLVEGSDSFNICVPADGLAYNIVNILCSPLPVVSVGGGSLVVDVGALFAILSNTETVNFTRKGDPDAARTRLAIIGSYGKDGTAEGKVAALVKTWQPDDIIAAGDNNYPTGQVSTIDDNVGKHYHGFMKPYTGGYGAAAVDRNRFWPVPGEADWGNVIGGGASIQPYKDYFPAAVWNPTLYYKQTLGQCEVFFIDSDKNEPAGFTNTSTQAVWLQAQLAASTAKWKIVVFHHTPYASVSGYVDNWMNTWNFALWGANVVITGHAKIYERLLKSGVTYLNVGTGGQTLDAVGTAVADSQFRYGADWGAALIEANAYSLRIRFCDTTGFEQDSIELFANDTNKVSAFVKYNRDGGLKVGTNGLEIDFNNMGFIRSLFQEAINRWANVLGVAGNYTYIAYASDSSGGGFTNTFNPALNYIAIKVSPTPILIPGASDFSGLWKNYGGGNSSLFKNIVYVDRNYSALASAGVDAYGTAQGAYDRALTLVSGGAPKVVIRIGQGTLSDFGNIILTANYEPKIELSGLGANISQIGSIGVTNTSSACFTILGLNARDCTIDKLLASPNATVSTIGKSISVTGNAVINTVDARGGSAALGGDITATGITFTDVTTRSYPASAANSIVTLTDCKGGSVTTKGGPLTGLNSVLGVIDTSFSDFDGSHATGLGGNVTLDNCTYTSIVTSGLAYTGGTGPNLRPPMDSGNVVIKNFSTGGAISTVSTNGKGGFVQIYDSVCDTLDTTSDGNITAQPESAQISGAITLRNATVTEINAFSHKGYCANITIDQSIVTVGVSSASQLSAARNLLSINRSTVQGTQSGGYLHGGNVIAFDSTFSTSIYSQGIGNGSGGSVRLIRCTVGLDISTLSIGGVACGAGGDVYLENSTVRHIQTECSNTSGSVEAGKVTLIASKMSGVISANSDFGLSNYGVLYFDDVIYSGQIDCLRSGSVIKNSTIRVTSTGVCFAEATDENGAPLVTNCLLIASGVAKTFGSSSPGTYHVRVGHCTMKYIVGTDVVNDYGTPYNIVDALLT